MFKVTEYAALRVKKFMMEDPSYIKFEAQWIQHQCDVLHLTLHIFM